MLTTTDADADLHHLPGTVIDWVGEGLHGEPGGSKQVPAVSRHDDEEDDADADLHHLPGIVFDWVGGGLHGEPGGRKQVPASIACLQYIYFNQLYPVLS